MSPAFNINESHFDLLANILRFSTFLIQVKKKSFYHNTAQFNQLTVDPYFTCLLKALWKQKKLLI